MDEHPDIPDHLPPDCDVCGGPAHPALDVVVVDEGEFGWIHKVCRIANGRRPAIWFGDQEALGAEAGSTYTDDVVEGIGPRHAAIRLLPTSEVESHDPTGCSFCGQPARARFMLSESRSRFACGEHTEAAHRELREARGESEEATR